MFLFVCMFVCLLSFFIFLFLGNYNFSICPGNGGKYGIKKCSYGNVRHFLRKIMLVTIMKLQCYIYTYRNLCVCICGRWGGEKEKCKNTINFSNLHRYVPSGHTYSQTTRDVLQIRVTYNFLCLCQRLQPHAPARSSSPSTELRVRLCCLSSVHNLKDVHFLHHSSRNCCFLRPLHDHLRRFLFLLASFSSVPLTATDQSLISHLPVSLLTIAKTANPRQCYRRSDVPVHQVTSSSFFSHFSKAFLVVIAHFCCLHLLFLHHSAWTMDKHVKWPPSSAGKPSSSLTFPHEYPWLCYSPG